MKAVGWCFFLWPLALLCCLAQQTPSLASVGFAKYAEDFPTCALKCLAETLPVSECQSFTNSTCICTNKELFAATEQCATLECSVVDMMTTLDTFQQACGIPERQRRSEVLGITGLEIFTIACIVIRLYVRFRMADQLEIDDCTVVLIFFTFLAFLGAGWYLCFTAIGYDIWNLEESQITIALELFYICELIYIVILAMCRVSVLFFLMRVFTDPTFRKVCWGVMAWVVVAALIFLICAVMQCQPRQFVWLGWKGDFGWHKCMDVNALGYANAGNGIAQDIVIIVLPLPMIAQLRMPWKRKFHLATMFSLGVLAVITSCLRLDSLHTFANTQNPTWDYVDPIIWTSSEVCASIICICLPSMRILFARALPRVFGSDSDRSVDVVDINLVGGRGADRHKSQGYKGLGSSSGGSVRGDKTVITTETHVNPDIEMGHNTCQPPPEAAPLPPPPPPPVPTQNHYQPTPPAPPILDTGDIINNTSYNVTPKTMSPITPTDGQLDIRTQPMGTSVFGFGPSDEKELPWDLRQIKLDGRLGRSMTTASSPGRVGVARSMTTVSSSGRGGVSPRFDSEGRRIPNRLKKDPSGYEGRW